MVKDELKKYYFVIGVVVIVLFLLVGFIFLIAMPSYNTIKKQNLELKARRTDLETLNDKLSKLQILKDKEDQLKREESIVVRALPTKKEVGELFIELDGLIVESSGSVKTVIETTGGTGSSTPASTFSVPGATMINYSFEVSFPSYAKFKEFLDKSHIALRYLTLSSFSVKNSGENSFAVDLNYVTYYRN